MNVYLDYAAATPLDPKVYAAMRPWLTKKFANPSALYGSAVQARAALEAARQKVAEILFTQPDTIIFTSGGTESINLAIQGMAKKQKNTCPQCFAKRCRRAKTKKHVVTTLIEHQAVLGPIRQLEKDGWGVTYLPVDQPGIINVAEFKKGSEKKRC